MAKPVVVNIPHTLGREDAMRRARSALQTLNAKLAFITLTGETWTDDACEFVLQALGFPIAGSMAFTDSNVAIEVRLPALLGGHAETVKATIGQHFGGLLEKK